MAQRSIGQGYFDMANPSNARQKLRADLSALVISYVQECRRPDEAMDALFDSIVAIGGLFYGRPEFIGKSLAAFAEKYPVLIDEFRLINAPAANAGKPPS